MNKNDLIAAVSSSAGLSKSDSTRAIESLLDTITNSLKRQEKVSIVGFGAPFFTSNTTSKMDPNMIKTIKL